MQTPHEGWLNFILHYLQVFDQYFKTCRFQSILSVFRSIGNLEKTVETCKISLPLSESLLIIELKCKHGIAKLYNLRYFEYEGVEVSITSLKCKWSYLIDY